MRLLRRLAAIAALTVVGACTAVVAAAGDPPVWTGSLPDRVGDAGSGPDISALAVTVNANQTISLSFTLASGGIPYDQTVQFFVTAPMTNAMVNVAEFGDGSPPVLATWDGSEWKNDHLVSGDWSGATFTTTLAFDDLQSALQAPVRPGLWVSVSSYAGAHVGETSVETDSAPDTGYLPVQTAAAAPTTTAVTTTAPPPPPSAPPTTTAKTAEGPTGPAPAWRERIVRLPHARIEWKRLAITRIPTGARVSLRCTKGCSRSESPRAVKGTATSTRFVGVPFRRGQAFLTKVIEPDGAGWWWQTTIVARPGGQETATRDGCYLTDGTSRPLAGC
jgi:hypothetical protein